MENRLEISQQGQWLGKESIQGKGKGINILEVRERNPWKLLH